VNVPAESLPQVVIIILNWNGLADTLHCLRELLRLDYPNHRTVVVDNGSNDGSPGVIRARHPEVTIIRNDENLGFTGGVNGGLRYAREQGADYVWLLNNDAVVPPQSLSILVETAERSAKIGLVSPVVRFYDRPADVQFAGTLLDPSTEEGSGDPDDPNAWPVLVGTALLVKADVIDKIGFFDDRYFAYCEDWDYSVRALQAGFEVLVERATTILHKPTGSMGRESPVKEYYMVRNRYLFWRSHLPAPAQRWFAARFVGWALERVLNARTDGKELLVPAALDGMWDALRGRTGPRPPGPRMPAPLRWFLSRVLLRWRPYMWIVLFRQGPRAVMRETWRRTIRRAGA
jgi:GT2 family glycosyltransferase